MKSRNQREVWYAGWIWIAVLIKELPTGEQLWQGLYRKHGRLRLERSLRKHRAKP